MWIELLIVVGLCLLTVPTVRFVQKLKFRAKLYNFEHLVDLAKRLVDVRKELDKASRSSGTLQGRLETAPGVVIVYTVVTGNGEYAHHLDLSLLSAKLGSSTAAFLVTYVMNLVEVEAKDIECVRTQTSHYHVAFKLDRKAHRRIMKVRGHVPTQQDLSTIVSGCLKTSREIVFEEIKSGVPDPAEAG